ncbi:glycoside hydrolase [Marinilabiliaceae bacterium JC017]|nr:glycoside hydrolase [Marinilabiliaceae bacterium JC017]
MSIKKQFLKSRPECKVTFQVKELDGIKQINSVKVVGEFNEWNTSCEPMKKLRNGYFTQTINLGAGQQIQFRYLVNDTIWVNDPMADEYVPNGVVAQEQNAVLNLVNNG